jgi:AcrR family transcriptional regulator
LHRQSEEFMKEKIVKKATDLFLKLGFKSITMDDIAGEMCISKKTIYKYFSNKEALIAECTEIMHKTVHEIIEKIIAEDYNPIRENFEIRQMFTGIFQSAETSPLFQLKKHYPEIYQKVIEQELEEGYRYLKHNIEKGIKEGWYRPDIDVESTSKLYYMLNFAINEHIQSEKEAQEMEVLALQYHTRAISTPKGIAELEKQLSNQFAK